MMRSCCDNLSPAPCVFAADRYVDLVAERHTDAPQYYICHTWTMPFRALVETLAKHFDLSKQKSDDVR